jgi:hypothetical protein
VTSILDHRRFYAELLVTAFGFGEQRLSLATAVGEAVVESLKVKLETLQ